MKPSKQPRLPSVGEVDQAAAVLRDYLVPLYASVFRAFLAEDGITRADALEMTSAFIAAHTAKHGGRGRTE